MYRVAWDWCRFEGRPQRAYKDYSFVHLTKDGTKTLCGHKLSNTPLEQVDGRKIVCSSCCRLANITTIAATSLPWFNGEINPYRDYMKFLQKVL
jgi:hypothetical protein